MTEDSQTKQIKVDFEAQIQELEKLVKEMEGGALTLEQSLDAFESGVKIANKCKQALTQAEARVSKLMKEMNIDAND